MLADPPAVAGEPAAIDPRDPDFWRGRFFPNNCRDDRGVFESTGRVVVLPVDYLPTPAVLAMAVAFHGPRCLDILDRWKRLWVTALGEDIERYLGDKAPLHGEGLEGWALRMRWKSARWLEKNNATNHAADYLYDTFLYARDEGVRDPAHHVLQDAVRHLALVDEGVAFHLCVGVATDNFGSVVVVEPDGSKGLRVVEEDSRRGLTMRFLDKARSATDPYWRMDAFKERCGRPMALATGFRHLSMVLLDMAGQGHRKAFLKGRASKTGTWVVDLAPGEDAVAMTERLVRILGAEGMARFSFSSGMFLVQAFMPFVREHRFLVVAHRVVASTASDREIGVMDADATRILGTGVARLRRPAGEEGCYDRGAADVVVDRTLLARMAWGARDLARAMCLEMVQVYANDRDTDCYCIDMGETEDGRVVPIEVNCLSRCGLYAADYRRVARALAKRATRLEAGERGAAGDPAPVPGRMWWAPLVRGRPNYRKVTLEIHDITGWPIFAVADASVVVDGKPADEGVIAWVVRAPDGRIVHGSKVHHGAAELVGAMLPLSGLEVLAPEQWDALVQVEMDRPGLVGAILSEGGDTTIDSIDMNLADRMLTRLGFPMRPVPAPDDVATAGIRAFPAVLADVCIGQVSRRFWFGESPWIMDVPSNRALATKAGTVAGNSVEPLAWLRANPIPVEWSKRELYGGGDYWPLPAGADNFDVRKSVVAGNVMGSDEGRIAVALAAHAPRVRLAAIVDDDGVSVWLMPMWWEDDAAGPEDAAAVAWDIVKGYVICGLVPPVKLVLDAVAAGIPDGLPPEVVAGMRRSFEGAGRVFRQAEAAVASL